jgi:hypothetical protein
LRKCGNKFRWRNRNTCRFRICLNIKREIILTENNFQKKTTLFDDNCGEANGFVWLLFIWDVDGVPDVIGGVNVFAIKSPCSWLFPIELLTALEFDDVEVILQTDTAFFRYFLSRRVVPLVIPTS